MNRMSLRAKGLFAAAVAAGGLCAMAGPASAAANPHAMNLVVVRQILGPTAGSPGNVNARLSNGTVISIPVSEETLVKRGASAVPPNEKIVGPCGSSNLTIRRKANGHPIAMTTGFTINSSRPGAIFYSWRVGIISLHADAGHTFARSSGLADRHVWTGSYTSPNNFPHDVYRATLGPASFALLGNGDVCVPGALSTVVSL